MLGGDIDLDIDKTLLKKLYFLLYDQFRGTYISKCIVCLFEFLNLPLFIKFIQKYESIISAV